MKIWLILFLVLTPLCVGQEGYTLAAGQQIAHSGGGGSAAPVFNAAGTPCDSSSTGCTVTQTIASGHLIVAYFHGASTLYTSFSITDSASDAFSSCTLITDAGGTRQAQLFYAIASTTVTSITLNVVAQVGGDLFLLPYDYTNPAALTTATILDKCLPGAQNENVSSWTTGASSATTNATDLVTAFFWTNTGTYTIGAGFTSRATNCCASSSLMEDLTTSVTGAQTGTATLSTTGFGPGVGAAFK